MIKLKSDDCIHYQIMLHSEFVAYNLYLFGPELGLGDLVFASVVCLFCLRWCIVFQFIQSAFYEKVILSFNHSFITKIYIAPLHGYCSEVLPILEWLNRTVLRLEQILGKRSSMQSCEKVRFTEFRSVK